jgi:hypothetical protein
MKVTGVVFWRGISPWTAEPIVAIATGIDGQSLNAKTGPMIQTWVLVRDVPPQEAKRQGLDASVCGDCKLRGVNGRDSICYLPVWVAPHRVWKAFRAGNYLDVSSGRTAGDRRGSVRAPLRLRRSGGAAVRGLAHAAGDRAGWVGYTHAWRRCDHRFKTICMASVDTEDEYVLAGLRGWRTFRIRGQEDSIIGLRNVAVQGPSHAVSTAVPLEFACPASDEMQHRTTCQACQLCRGTSSPARSVAIVAHGHNGAMAAFHKSRRAAEVARRPGGRSRRARTSPSAPRSSTSACAARRKPARSD